MHRSPTGLERLKITRRTHSILGEGNEAAGHLELAALKMAIQEQARIVREEIGEVEDVEKAWETHESEAAIMYADLSEQAGDLYAMARWELLAVDVPERFRNLAESDIEERVVMALRVAWWKAEDPTRAGKEQPSES
ncbi:MAG: hypothetical protein WC911_01960 [Thermoleophilia bacterium]